MSAKTGYVGPIRVEPEMREALEALAQASDRSVSYVIRQMITERLSGRAIDIPGDLADQLRVAAAEDRVSQSEIVRESVQRWLETRDGPYGAIS